MSQLKRILSLALLSLVCLCGCKAHADEAAIKENLVKLLPSLPPIDEVTPTPMPGIFEVRIGTELLYTDAQGNYILQGEMLDLRNHKNLSEERIDKLTAVAFKDLPLNNAIAISRGNGKRQLALFEDPNCPYCKRFEQDLQTVNNVTVHVFVLPILGADSVEKTNQIWCSKDRAAAWLDWMLHDVKPKGSGKCDLSAVKANLEFSRKYNLSSTPTLIFSDNRRVSGAIPAQHIEQFLQ